jgi:hypothetical protein
VATSGPDLDAARSLVVERNLVAAAFEHLTVEAFMTLPFEALGPTKAALKRFFSAGPWGPDDDEALAAAVGPGEGHWRHPLDGDLVLDFGWDDGRFGLRVEATATDTDHATEAQAEAVPPASGDDPLAATFDGPVVPEATPNPRTIRFQVGPIHDGPSRWYESAAGADAAHDPGAARLFSRFPEVANVLVGPDFVAVGLRRAADWERALQPVLAAVTDEFASSQTPPEPTGPRVTGGPAGAGVATGPGAGGGAGGGAGRGPGLTRLEQAWRDLGDRRPADPADLAVVEQAAAGSDPARRQVAANLLREADAATAAAHWARLVTDPLRSVRRAAVDAMVDVGREELRPLLEAALDDADAWVRWKALRGLTELGAGPSQDAIAARTDDADFRVRLEAAAALRGGG